MFTLECTSYANQDTIPLKHVFQRAKGQNVSPGFTWTDPPITTKSFALCIVDLHPVANNWIHWCVINIPFRERSLKEGASRSSSLPPGARELLNSFGEQGYGGPAPPRGSGPHRYVATLYALNTETLPLQKDSSLRLFTRAIEGKIIADASVTGYYEQK